jgi:LmbE family N-acetylglucosaminyl deacetylase
MENNDLKSFFKFFNKGNILFLGCHLDDIEFGCGGIISKLVASGLDDKIFYCTLSNFNKSSEDVITIKRDLNEAYSATECLGIKRKNILIKDIPGQLFQQYSQNIRETLIEIKESINPEYIFFPSKNDVHQDHQTLHQESIRIFRNANCFGYEVIRSSYDFCPNLYIRLDENELNKKVDAIMSYKSQMTQSAGYYFDKELIRSISVFRGGQSNKRLAEAYEIYFMYL